MPNFDSELSQLASDVIGILGSRSITLRQPGTTTLTSATRQRETGTFTDFAVSAVKDVENPEPVSVGEGTARVVRCLYTVSVADLADVSAPTPGRGWRLVDATVEWQVTEVSMDVDGKMVDLVCTRAF